MDGHKFIILNSVPQKAYHISGYCQEYCLYYICCIVTAQVQGFTVQVFSAASDRRSGQFDRKRDSSVAESDTRVLSDKESRICEELRAKETDTRCFRVINAYCRRFPFRIEYIIHPTLTIRQVTNREPDNLGSYLAFNVLKRDCVQCLAKG